MQAITRFKKQGTLISFNPKDKTMLNAKNPKKIARLTLVDALMCPKT